MNLNENHLAVLTALRGAEMLRRAPTTLSLDGHQHWWSLAELTQEGRLPVPGEVSVAVNRAARTLYKHGLVIQRTTFGKVRFCLTDDGRRELAAYEAGHGLADLREAEMALAQAYEDQWQAQNALKTADAAIAPAQERVLAEKDKLKGVYGQ